MRIPLERWRVYQVSEVWKMSQPVFFRAGLVNIRGTEAQASRLHLPRVSDRCAIPKERQIGVVPTNASIVKSKQRSNKRIGAILCKLL